LLSGICSTFASEWRGNDTVSGADARQVARPLRGRAGWRRLREGGGWCPAQRASRTGPKRRAVKQARRCALRRSRAGLLFAPGGFTPPERKLGGAEESCMEADIAFGNAHMTDNIETHRLFCRKPRSSDPDLLHTVFSKHLDPRPVGAGCLCLIIGLHAQRLKNKRNHEAGMFTGSEPETPPAADS